MSKPSLHSWRYCVLGEGDLAAEPLYQSSESWRRSRHERRSREEILISNLFQYVFQTPRPHSFFLDRGSAAKTKITQYTIPPAAQASQNLGNGPGVGECPALGQCKICKCPTPGTDKACKFPAVARGGGWAQVELTDALSDD